MDCIRNKSLKLTGMDDLNLKTKNLVNLKNRKDEKFSFYGENDFILEIWIRHLRYFFSLFDVWFSSFTGDWK